MRKCDKKVKKGQGKRRQSNKGTERVTGARQGKRRQGKKRQNNRGTGESNKIKYVFMSFCLRALISCSLCHSL